jgi:hypothetical protein
VSTGYLGFYQTGDDGVFFLEQDAATAARAIERALNVRDLHDDLAAVAQIVTVTSDESRANSQRCGPPGILLEQ